MPVTSSNITTHIDSVIRRSGDTAFVTIVTRKELIPEIGAIDQVREYLAILIWPLAAMLIAYWLRNRLRSLKWGDVEAKFNSIIDNTEKALEKENQ
jgi:hypothetical protein